MDNAGTKFCKLDYPAEFLYQGKQMLLRQDRTLVEVWLNLKAAIIIAIRLSAILE